MRKLQAASLALAVSCMAALLFGCSNISTTDPMLEAASLAVSTSTEHAPVTMQSPFRNMSAFIDEVHKKYPEINLEVIPYSGKNYSTYVRDQLLTGDMPDIYCATYYVPDRYDVSDKLIDLSGYAFTDNYSEARLREVASSDGSLYAVPTYYDCIGITYNKTLLEKHGWSLPSSLEELRELAPKVEEAGCRLALDEVQLPGYGFQYLFNILNAGFINTPDGRKWQNDFISGKTTVKDSPQMMEALQVLAQWRDIGMFNDNAAFDDDEDTRLMMAEGNTLFLLGSSNTFTDEETTDEFALMPFLSEDGSQNAYILNVSRYIGLNKHLEDAGNEQKLQDALHVMEVLSTVEGMQALNSKYAETSLLPLKDYEINATGVYAELEARINAGETAPFIYSGWENLVVPVGTAAISYIRGEATLDDIVAAFDDNQYLLEDNSDVAYTTAMEELDTDDCARLVGICYAEATSADMALISKNKWYDNGSDLNPDGVSGSLYPVPITAEEIVSILPAGWKQTIQTVTLTGKRVKELAEEGYDLYGDGNTFPYELVTPDGFEIDDNAVYTVAVAGVTDAVAKEGDLQDSGVVGLTAAEQFFSQFATLSKKDIAWK